MGSRKYLVGVLVVVLLIWGPIDHSWPAWLAIRTGYLIAVPVATWYVLDWVWKSWHPDPVTEDRFERALGALTGGVFLALAYRAGTAATHMGNTAWVRTRDGMEAVGDDIVLQGPDWGIVIFLVAAAGFSFWFSIGKRER